MRDLRIRCKTEQKVIDKSKFKISSKVSPGVSDRLWKSILKNASAQVKGYVSLVIEWIPTEIWFGD
jgi:hypothetical protein